MTRKISTIGLILLMVLQSKAFAGIEFQELNLSQALEKAKQENKMVFVDVFAVWCGPCKYLSKEVFTDEELGAYMNAHFVSIKIDGEQGEGPELMERFAIDAYPTMLFIGADNELRKRIVGAESQDVIMEVADFAMHPEKSPEYIMGERFKAGDRDRAFLGEYLSLLLEQDLDTDPVVSAFLENYPDIKLEDEMEFLFFIIGVKDREHPKMKEFFAKSTELAESNSYLTNIKFMMIFANMRDEYLAGKDAGLIEEEFILIYDSYARALGEEAYDPDAILANIFDTETEE